MESSPNYPMRSMKGTHCFSATSTMTFLLNVTSKTNMKAWNCLHFLKKDQKEE